MGVQFQEATALTRLADNAQRIRVDRGVIAALSGGRAG